MYIYDQNNLQYLFICKKITRFQKTFLLVYLYIYIAIWKTEVTKTFNATAFNLYYHLLS